MKVKELVRLLIDAHADDAEVVYDWNMLQIVVAPSIDAARAARPNTGRMCLVHSVGRVVEVQTTRSEIEVVR
jgi:hypothetical protein